jgi:CotH kinase protein/Divergent InlB B-repeat domain/Chitobiase/beta-hexosaminidase C-terminal domain
MRKHTKLVLSLTAIAIAAALFHAAPLRDPILRQLWSLNQAHYQEFAQKVKARKLPQIDKRFSLTLGDSLPPIPVAQPSGGFFTEPLEVRLALPPGHDLPIYYSLDGSIPTHRDSLYRGAPIRVDTVTVLRFRCLVDTLLPGQVGSETYVVGKAAPSLPLLSIITDPVHLWNKYSGIYEHPFERGRSWERQADMHYLRQQDPPFALVGELRIHGGYSRLLPKKSFRFRFQVPPKLNLEPDHILLRTQWQGENTVVIRAGGVGHRYRIRDALSGLLYASIGGHASAFEPVFVRLNGQPWGVYDLRERIDDGWLRLRFGEGEYELIGFDSKNPTKWGTPIVGTSKHWEKTLRFFAEHELNQPAPFEAAAALVDVDKTIDYWIHNIYVANVDWPYNNFNAWRKVTGDGRWGWISWDADGTFDDQGKGLRHNTLEWSLRDRVRNDLKWNYTPGHYEDKAMYLKSTLIMRRLLENPETRRRFILRAHDLLNTTYQAAPALQFLAAIRDPVEADRRADFARWGWSDSAYLQDMERINTFLRLRPKVVRGHFATRFGLGESVPLSLEPVGFGRIGLNTLPPTDTAWTGLYPTGMDIELEAQPDAGYAFSRWEGDLTFSPDSSRVRFQLKGPAVLRAVFRPLP